ncbi:DUF2058 family protein [Pseudomonadota bacterium]
MSNSLKDQLLALGLAPKKSKPEPKKRHIAQAKTVRPQKRGGDEISLDQAYSIRNREERQQKERAIELKREQERQRRETNQKIKGLIKQSAIRDPAAENKRNFLYKGRIRSVLATPDQINEINAGSMGIVYLSGSYHLMPAEVIEEIRQFAPDHIPDLSGAEYAEEEENPVPDDLIW